LGDDQLRGDVFDSTGDASGGGNDRLYGGDGNGSTDDSLIGDSSASGSVTDCYEPPPRSPDDEEMIMSVAWFVA
jgi:hypothetical protein